jgi:hypothetical protein
VLRVDRVLLCRVYVDSNHRDSDMSTACLWQSSRRSLNQLNGLMVINKLCYALL